MKKKSTKIDLETLPPLIKLSLVAELMSVSTATLRIWDKNGKLPAVRIGERKDRRYKKEDVLKALNEGV